MPSHTPATNPQPLRRLLGYARGERRAIWLAVACSVTNKLLDLAPPFLIGMAVDVVVEKEHSFLGRWGVPDVVTQLWILSAITVIVWVLESLFEYWLGILWRNLAQRLQHSLRMDAYSHVQRLDLSYFEDRSTGGLVAVLNDDVNQLERFLDGGANDLIQLFVTAAATIATFFVLEPRVALIAMLPLPFVIWGSLAFQRRIAPRYHDVREKAGLLASQLAGNVSGIATVKSYAAEPFEAARIGAESLDYVDANRRAIRMSAAFAPLIRMVIVIGFTTTLLYGGVLVVRGELSVGAYSLLTFLTQRLLWPFTRLGQVLDLYQRGMASARRIFELLATRIAVEDGPRPLAVANVRGAVRFDRVTFSYVPGHPVLRDVTIDCPAGQTTAIVGSTGGGKTTVLKLLLRLYDRGAGTCALDGSITLDGIEIRDLRLADLRRSIAVVSQDVFLFHGTVAENIAYGLVGSLDGKQLASVSHEAIVRAARLAEAEEFIVRLPKGYDTLVGERGQKLSGGQRQRIAMARAILKDAPVLVLDEATSSVDNETELAIQRSLATICRNRTTLAIAHRLSTIRHADRIYVLDEGSVVEEGTHDELTRRPGLYRTLWRIQTGEGAEPGVEAPVVR
ncbi:MAG: ABC transporter ATP-binding protein [Phycisphaerae bacterium]|nr:ABC transporter ATP-binding protein [Phycisphaerae bacterium]